MSKHGTLRALLAAVGALPALAGLLGCTELLRSDAANASRNNGRARDHALQNNRRASQEAAPARVLAGEELSRRLTGKTHVSEFRKASHDAKPFYATYAYFATDGRYHWLNTYERRDPQTATPGTWRVDGEVLCVTRLRGIAQPLCFTLRLQDNGTLQYWTHQPGDPFHGLITADVHIVRDGQQLPEFISRPEQMQ
jgi:hypothetical protein